MFKSLRLQLTVWYLLFFSILFLLFCGLLYGLVSRALERRLQENLAAEAQTAASLFREELREMAGDGKGAAADVISEMDPHGIVLSIFERSEILGESSPEGKPEVASLAAKLLSAADSNSELRLPDWGANGALAAAQRVEWQGRTFSILTIGPLDAVARQLQLLRDILWTSIPLLLLISGIGGYLLTRRRLAPLAIMAEQSRQMTGENLERRIEIGNAAEELAVLAASFNELLSRLDASFKTMRRFVQDASHEMRTPIAVIRGEAEVALSQDRSAAEYKESLTIIHEESRRLSRLVDDLLNLARADAGRVQLREEELYLNDLLAESCRSVQPLANARQIELECRSGDDVAFRGDEQLLRRMVVNLLDNAIRYTPPGGKVSATLEAQGSDVRIRVADTGVGIDRESSRHVFERFYRADQARSRQQDGFGLGLSIVKWIAESHHGRVELESDPGRGSTFTVHLAKH
jgi:heavy metal sensor kinase